MAFQAPKLTNAGKALYYENMAGAQLTITTIKMGSGTLAGSIANLTDLVEPVVVIDAFAAVREGYVDVSGTFSNADLEQGFYWREIGVFAANPDDPENREADILYCYQNAYDTADYIPVASVETVEKNIAAPIIVGDAAAVSCTLDRSLVLATLKDLQDHDNDPDAHKALLQNINKTLEGKQDKIRETGLLKGTGLKVIAAVPGTDYQAPTQELTNSDEMALTDTVPFFSSAAGQNRKVSLAVLKAALGVQSASINVTTCAGASVVCTDGKTTLNGVGSTKFSLPENTGEWTVTATLDGESATRQVEVTGALQYNVDLMITTGVAVTHPPTNTAYDVGDKFDTTGLVVTATFADGTTEDVTQDCKFSPETMEANTKTVTITYERAGRTLSTTQAVTVRQLSSISVITPPNKKAYYIGENFDPAGTVIQASMSDGSTKTVSGWTYSPTGALAAGNTTITFSYTENSVTKTCTYTITIRALTSIAVTTPPSKTTYNYGEKFASAGMVITATYNDGATRVVSGWTYSPTGNLNLSNTTITISYAEGGTTKTCTQAITVKNTLTSISVATPPSKTSYFAGESFSTAGMVIKATYGDGSTGNVSGYTYSPTGPLAASNKQITISYTYNGTTKTCTQAITVTEISTTLNSNSWATIRAVSDASKGTNYWSTGATKTITINGKVGNTTFSNLSIDVFILGFNHNASREGANRIHFKIGKIGGAHVALVDSNYNNNSSSAANFQMNASNTNSGGWSGSSMRKTLLGNNGNPTSPPANSLLAALPADLRAVMKSCTKYTDNTGGGNDNAGYVTSTTDYLFLLAEFEFHGARTYANSAEKNYQAQYDYYKAGNSKVHYKHNATGTAAGAWCRSPYSSSSYSFCLVNTAGSANYNNADWSYGVAPGFCA